MSTIATACPMTMAGTLASGLLASVGDDSATRTVYGVVAALVVIGLVLVGLAIWLLRQTRVDAPLLAPLELMSDRAWRKRDPATQRRLLDEVRPPHAEPLQRATGQPDVDADFERADRPVPSLADLAGEPADAAAPPEVDIDAQDEPIVADAPAWAAPAPPVEIAQPASSPPNGAAATTDRATDAEVDGGDRST